MGGLSMGEALRAASAIEPRHFDQGHHHLCPFAKIARHLKVSWLPLTAELLGGALEYLCCHE